MPNGFHGPNEEWVRLEAPLLALDPAIESFAQRHGLTVGRNYHNWPERSVRWGRGIERLIQVYLSDEHRLLFTLWLCASEDRSQGRFWKQRTVYKNARVSEISRGLDGVLEESKREVHSWQSHDLVRA
jgi:hypothetical protein